MIFEHGEYEFLVKEFNTAKAIATEKTGGFTTEYVGFDDGFHLYAVRGANGESLYAEDEAFKIGFPKIIINHEAA